VDVAAPEDDVLRLERGDETTDDVLDVARLRRVVPAARALRVPSKVASRYGR
jgi:hypothetical protein